MIGHRTTALLSSLGLILALAAPAAADTSVGVVGDTVFVSAEGESNSMEFKIVGGKYRTVDEYSVVLPSAGCVREPPADAHVVDCTGNLFKAVVGLGEGTDDDFTTFNYIELEMTIDGEGGKDEIVGGAADDTLRGNAGDDYSDGAGGDDFLSDGYAGVLSGGLGSGDDAMYGGPGDDYLDGGSFAVLPDAGSGADVLGGGTGVDTADYSKRTQPLRLTEGDGANDGQDTGGGPGSEGDDLADAETIVGGSAGDTIVGAAGPNTLRGGPGDDSLDGGLGPDAFQGGPGTDTASYAGRTKPVTVSFDEEANDGEPGEGDDVAPGTENVVGGGAGDRILAANGSTNRITCGAGADTVEADAFDTVAADCEGVTRAAAPDPGSGGLAALGLPKRLKVKHGVARVRVACPASAVGGCAKGRLSARGGGRTLARARFSVAAGETAVVELHLGRAKPKRVRLLASADGAASASRQAELRTVAQRS